MEAFQNKIEVQSSPLCKIVRFLSTCYLLPLDIDFKGSKVSFSLLSCKTCFHALIMSLPWTLVALYMFLNADYYIAVRHAVFDLYTTIDIGALILIIGSNTNPLVFIFSTSLGAKPWAKVPELSMDKNIKFPKYMKFIVSFMVLVFFRRK